MNRLNPKPLKIAVATCNIGEAGPRHRAHLVEGTIDGRIRRRHDIVAEVTPQPTGALRSRRRRLACWQGLRFRVIRL